MWNRWQKRRHSPNHHYEDSPILSTQGGYMLQVLWYTLTLTLTLTPTLTSTLPTDPNPNTNPDP